MADGVTPGAIRELVRAAAFAIATSEYALAGRIALPDALEAVANELAFALHSLGVEPRDLELLSEVVLLNRRNH